MHRALILGACALVLVLAACARGTADAPAPALAPAVPPARVAAAAPRTPAAPAAPRYPAIEREPELGVLLLRGSEVSVRLLQACQLPDGGELAAGALSIRAAGDGFAIAGRRIAGPQAVLTPRADGPTLAIGAGRAAERFAGRIVLARDRGEVLVIERIGLEAWLPGVLTAEMNPNWPVEALAAQAIVARSYAAARWQARQGEPWQLMRGTADIAYDGAVEGSAAIADAVRRTRGLLLVHGGQAILARFHACSGGRTEDSSALWPDATLADGTTPLAPYTIGVDDPASAAGARALGWTATHQDWKAAIPLAEITRALKAWAAEVPSRPRIGEVKGVRIAATRPSGRVERVEIVHRGPGGERSDAIDAQEFRLAVGANRLRSLWWERCTAASAGGGKLVIEGHGFGHGVGLPQVSAWQLASQGMKGEDIVQRFYAAATLARLWR